MAYPRNIRIRNLAIGLITMPLLLASCGSGDTTPVPDAMPEQGREFSAEEKRAALALSIGNVQALSAETSAYDRSLLCSIALESVGMQLSQGGQLDPAVVDAVEQVRAVYNNRVQQLGSAEGKTVADIAADRQQRSEQIPEQSERGQIAIGCLRAMA
jgi:transposase-like protein